MERHGHTPRPGHLHGVGTMPWPRGSCDVIHSYIRHGRRGRLSEGYLGPLCALLEISCDSIIISKCNTNSSQNIACVAHWRLVLEGAAEVNLVNRPSREQTHRTPSPCSQIRPLSHRWSREGQGRPSQAKKRDIIFISHLRHQPL